MTDEALRSAWLPVAAVGDLPLRHIFHGMLLGHELAIWRADDGTINVWENRCLHRGVRLTIGTNEGDDLRCQYHGWRYANRSGQCTHIPAHPTNVPARTMCSRRFLVAERYGFIWTAIDPDSGAPAIPRIDGAPPLVLRAVAINAPADTVLDALLHYQYLPARDAIARRGDRAIMETTRPDRWTVVSAAKTGSRRASAAFIVQPVARGRSVVRGLLSDEFDPADRIAVLRYHNSCLAELRSAIERPSSLPPEDAEPMVQIRSGPPWSVARRASLRVRVARKWTSAVDVAALRLEAVDGSLPDFEPGAHIDVHLPNGLVRQYSLTNGPGDTSAYIIGVKREPNSTGGSRSLHDELREGDVLSISEPHNNFALVKDAGRIALIAGGIGITPLLAMAKSLHGSGKAFTLHYFARSADHLAFAPDLAALGRSVIPHLGLDAARTATAMEEVLGVRSGDDHVFVCGPGPMLESARSIAKRLGWPDSAVHFEYFGNARARDDSSAFEVALARSGRTLSIPAGRSIVEVLRANGIEVPTSCEQGACGTCLTSVLDGEPDHQDVYLNDSERASGTCMLPCVSRSKSARLVLDL